MDCLHLQLLCIQINEDLNRDNTLNETEAYYEYQIDLKPGMDVGVTKYITDKKRVTVNSADGIVRQEDWYLFRVPIKDYSNKVGGIPDFKSIRFVRMYLTDFEDSVVLRFASLNNNGSFFFYCNFNCRS
jgi:cell surface protein SprA